MELYLGSYVSCIKIGNSPIIPPLLDDTRKEEMRYYRRLAVAVENRKKADIETAVTSSSESLPTQKEVPKSDTDDSTKMCYSTPPENLETDSGSDGTRDRSNSNTLSVFKTSRERSRSYTLDNPSPVLLAFIQSQQENRCVDDNSDEIFVDETNTEPGTPIVTTNHPSIDDTPEIVSDRSNIPKRKLWDTCQTLRNSADPFRHSVSLPNSNYVSPAVVRRSYKSDDGFVYDDHYLSNEDYEYIENIELQSLHDDVNSTQSSPTKCASFNGNDSFTKDFCLLDTSVNASMGRESTFSDCSSVSLNKFIPALDRKSTDCSEAEQEAFSYFKDQLRQKHRQQLALLLQEQQREHDMLKEQFQKISRASDRTVTSPSTPRAFSQNTFRKSPGKHKSPVVLDDTELIQLPIPNSSSSPKRKSSVGNVTKHLAASKIQAAVRGYLTRRLFKTSRVTLLVQTIRDCLVTAVSLQNETNLGLSELDLQNRLLQQLTTACNELNDIFTLPVKQRMAIIAEDRDKKKREFRRSNLPLPLSEATRRTLMRKSTKSLPPSERKTHRKRCKSASSVRSDSSVNNNLPSQRRSLNTSFTYKSSVPQPNRKPWR